MKLLHVFFASVLAKNNGLLEERGLNSCEGVKIKNVNGVEWHCGSKGSEAKNKKKCRGKQNMKKFHI